MDYPDGDLYDERSTGSGRNVRYWWRVSRYDPAHRDTRGAYRGDTWTSISDVGKRFGDSELTLDQYREVEDAYVDAFVAFAEDSDADRLEVRALDHGCGLREGDVLPIEHASELVRRMLRENVICNLEEPDDGFAVHVGFDLYMYVGSNRPCARAVERARDSGLYVDDDFPSPQLADYE
jgi:hypothetical protein